MSSIGNGTRDYTDPAVWESATDNDLVSALSIERAEIYADQLEFDWDLSMVGATTSLDYYREIVSASSNIVRPVWNPSNLAHCINVNEEFFRISGQQIIVDASGSGNYIGIAVASGGGWARIVENIIVAASNSGAGENSCISVTSTSGDVYIIKNVVGNADRDGIGTAVSGGVAYCYSNTVFNNGRYGVRSASGTVKAVNNISQGNGTNFSGSFIAGSDYNLSSSSDALGANSINNAINVFRPGSIYQLAQGDPAVDVGVDLSGDVNFPFAFDVNADLITSWSIGADAQAGPFQVGWQGQSMNLHIGVGL